MPKANLGKKCGGEKGESPDLEQARSASPRKIALAPANSMLVNPVSTHSQSALLSWILKLRFYERASVRARAVFFFWYYFCICSAELAEFGYKLANNISIFFEFISEILEITKWKEMHMELGWLESHLMF